MALTFSDAQTYVARSLGNSADTDQLAAAADSIRVAIGEYNIRHDFRFLLMDTSGGFSVASCTIAGDGITVTTSVANGFAGVNVNQGATGTGIPASTTVSSITSTTVIVLSAASTPGTITITFSADIPLRAGINTYNLPTPIKRPYDARLESNERTLIWKDQRELDRLFGGNLNTQGVPEFWNTFNTTSFTTGIQNGVIRIYRTPSATDTLRVRYYRPIAEPASGSTNLDFPDRYIYAFLELAKYFYLKDHDSDNPRTGETKERAERNFRYIVAEDTQGSEENDMAFVPQIEHNLYRRFDPDLPFGGV